MLVLNPKPNLEKLQKQEVNMDSRKEQTNKYVNKSEKPGETKGGLTVGQMELPSSGQR